MYSKEDGQANATPELGNLDVDHVFIPVSLNNMWCHVQGCTFMESHHPTEGQLAARNNNSTTNYDSDQIPANTIAYDSDSDSDQNTINSTPPTPEHAPVSENTAPTTSIRAKRRTPFVSRVIRDRDGDTWVEDPHDLDSKPKRVPMYRLTGAPTSMPRTYVFIEDNYGPLMDCSPFCVCRERIRSDACEKNHDLTYPMRAENDHKYVKSDEVEVTGCDICGRAQDDVIHVKTAGPTYRYEVRHPRNVVNESIWDTVLDKAMFGRPSTGAGREFFENIVAALRETGRCAPEPPKPLTRDDLINNIVKEAQHLNASHLPVMANPSNNATSVGIFTNRLKALDAALDALQNFDLNDDGLRNDTEGDKA